MMIKLRPIRAYELLAHDGSTPLATLHRESSWEGLTKLTTAEGQVLIIQTPSSMEESMAVAMAGIGGHLGVVECTLLSGSPSLIGSLLSTAGLLSTPEAGPAPC